VKTESVDLADFHWQAGYGAFSVSPAHVDALKQYIADQEKHHSVKRSKMNSAGYVGNTVSRSMTDMFGI